MDDPDSPDETTEVGVVGFWEDLIEDARAFAVKLVEKLPSFVPA